MVDFAKGIISEKQVGYSFFSLQNHVHTLQIFVQLLSNFKQFDKIIFLLEFSNLDIDLKGVLIFILQEDELMYMT